MIKLHSKNFSLTLFYWRFLPWLNGNFLNTTTVLVLWCKQRNTGGCYLEPKRLPHWARNSRPAVANVWQLLKRRSYAQTMAYAGVLPRGLSAPQVAQSACCDKKRQTRGSSSVWLTCVWRGRSRTSGGVASGNCTLSDKQTDLVRLWEVGMARREGRRRLHETYSWRVHDLRPTPVFRVGTGSGLAFSLRAGDGLVAF